MKTTIIMCVRKKGDSAGFLNSLCDCIGASGSVGIHEVVDAAGMGAGYNTGVRQILLQGGVNEDDVFVFTHQDVANWASYELWRSMLVTVARPGIGFVGVAGSTASVDCNLTMTTAQAQTYKFGPRDGGWWNIGHTLRGAVSHTDGQNIWTSAFGMFGNVRVMDGVFLACKRSVLDAIGPWPEDLGWHFYDIWATEQAHRLGLQNVVVPLPLLHGSIGMVKGDWAESRDLYLRKYASR